LGIRRAETEAFCQDSGIEFWNDPHNQDEKFTRVRIRNSVLPMLEEQLGPGIAEALSRTGEILTEDIDYLDSLALAEHKRIAKSGPTSIELPITDLEALPKVIRVRVYQRVLEVFAANNSRTHLVAIDELIENWHGQKELTLPGVRVIRQVDKISFKTTKTLNPGAC
jgi:tRNA(Ile)-lysidine synthase